MRESLVACDTSVLVPAVHPGYPMHLECRRQLPRLSALPAHVMLETFRVLSSTAVSGALAPGAIVQVLGKLGLAQVQLPAEQYFPLLELLASNGRVGGAIYDAQIAATCKHHGLKLLSRDRRAAATYELIGVDYELV